MITAPQDEADEQLTNLQYYWKYVLLVLVLQYDEAAANCSSQPQQTLNVYMPSLMGCLHDPGHFLVVPTAWSAARAAATRAIGTRNGEHDT